MNHGVCRLFEILPHHVLRLQVLFRTALALLLSNEAALLAQPSGSDALMFMRSLPRATLQATNLLPRILSVKFKVSPPVLLLLH